jgi:hypothetical protein
MVTNFKTYWEVNETILTKLGVEKDVAYMIWCAAADTLEKELVKLHLKQL